MKKEISITNNNNKLKQVNVRVSETEKKQLEELAKQHNISVAKLLLDTALKQKDLHNVNSITIAEKLCDLSFEIEYVTENNPLLKPDFEELRKGIIDLWHTIRI